jgi:sec-independent protein translocase protein TatC
VITLFFAFGIAFEVPVATILVVAVGITTPENLVKIRPYIFVAAFVIGMFLTPPDIISQTLLAVPMWLLYEVGIVFSRVYKKRIEEAGLARDKRYDDEGTDEDEADADSGLAEGGPATPSATGTYRNSLTDHDDSGDEEAERNNDEYSP